MRYDFYELFYRQEDGTICCKFPIRIHNDSVTIPADTCFYPGTTIGGLDIARHVGRHIKATIHDSPTDGAVYVIEKFYWF